MKWLFYISVLFISFSSFSQGATATIDKSKIKIGEQLLLTLKLNYFKSDSTKVIWPEFDNYLTNSIEIINKSPIDSTNNVCDSTICPQEKTQSMVITSFEPGNLIVPAIKFEVNDSTYSTEPIALLVETVEVDTTKGLYDVYPIYDVEYSFSEKIADISKAYWHWLLIALLVILIIILYLKNKNRPKPISEEPEVKIPAHIKALQTLNELKYQEAWQTDDHKSYYSKLTDTVREYLEDRFNILALEKTTAEIIQDLKHSDISTEDRAFLQQILQQADFVKFAKFKPQNEDGKIALEKSFDFVNQTKLIEDTEDVE